MSGIAALLLALGHRVSGSDKVDTVEVGRLEKKGLCFHIPHQADEVREAELIVYSSAIKAGNVAYDGLGSSVCPWCAARMRWPPS